MQKQVSDTTVCDYQTLYHVNQRPMDQCPFHSTAPKCTVLPSKTGVGLPTVLSFFLLRKRVVWMVAGLGNIAGLCSNRRVTICQEWNQFASVGTATHELGHKSVAFASFGLLTTIIKCC